MSQRFRVTVDSAVSMAIELHKRGELDEAQILYNDILRAVPDQPDALHYLGVAAHQLGDSEDGIEYIRRSLQVVPDSPDALNNLGNIYRETGRLEDADETYRKVLEIAPNHADTLVNLGVILRGLKQPDAALKHIERALEINPEHGNAYHNLGNIYFDLKRVDEALVAYRKSDELQPESEESSRSIAKLLHASKRTDEAIDVLQRLLARRPDDALARHTLAAYSGKDIPPRASDSYVRQIFDGYSASFDESLARLEYKAPKLIGELVASTLATGAARYQMLDIGCGTGLCGPLVKPHAESLTGVDLSPQMLKKAQRRGVYDHLEEAELTAYMSGRRNAFDVVICADTFVYFGDLAEAFVAACSTLRSKGRLFFTVEQHSEEEHTEGYWLQDHGRYSHSKSYLRATLGDAGLDVEVTDDVVLRLEGGKPVSGTLVVASKS